MLGVQLDEVRAGARQLPHRREPTVDVGAAAPVGGQDAGEDLLGAVVALEAALDAGLRGAPTHERRVGSPTEEQVERLDEQRLAGTRLAGDGGEPGPEQQRQVVDDPEIGDVQLPQQAAHRSASPNLVFRI